METLSFFFLLKRTKQTRDPTKGGFGTKDCMIFLLKKKKKKKKRGKKREEKKEKAKALERETMSQSPIDFLLILTVIKNPLLQLMKSVVACLFRHQLSEILGTPPPPHTHPYSRIPHLPHPCHHPWITCTEISGSTMYSNLVWIMCCSLGFLK